MNKRFSVLILFSFMYSPLFCMKTYAASERTKLYNNGKKYLKLNEEEQSFNFFLKAADKDHFEAQFRVALMLYKGIGCKQDLKKALKYCRILKKRNHKKANELFVNILSEIIVQTLQKSENLEEKMNNLEKTLKTPIKLDLQSILENDEKSEGTNEEELPDNIKKYMYT